MEINGKAINLLLDTVEKQQNHLKEQQKVLAELINIVKVRVEQNIANQQVVVVTQSAESSQPEPVCVEPDPVLQNEHECQSLGHEEPFMDFSELEPPIAHDVQEVVVIARQLDDEPVPALHEYVLESYDPREPFPVLPEEPHSAHSEPIDDFMGDGSYYDWVFSGETSDHFGDKYSLTSNEINMMIRDYDSIPKWCLPRELRNPSVDVNLDDSMSETLDSSHWSARCYNQLSEDPENELGLSADQLDHPRCHESEACGLLAKNSDIDQPLPASSNQNNAEYRYGGEIRKKRLCKHKLCKHCNSDLHKSTDCDHLQNMVENKGIYTLRKTWEPGDPESSHSRSSLGETSLIFYDDQPPLGEDDLSYVPRRWEIIEECDRLMGKPPEESFPPLFPPSFRAFRLRGSV